jgi:hypothetical protein
VVSSQAAELFDDVIEELIDAYEADASKLRKELKAIVARPSSGTCACDVVCEWPSCRNVQCITYRPQQIARKARRRARRRCPSTSDACVM